LRFKELKRLIYSDLCYARGSSIGIKHTILTIFFNPKFQLICNYRVSMFLEASSWGFLNIFTKYMNLIVFSSEISPCARLGENIQFAHPIGLVIGNGVVIGNNVVIYQHVTIGGKNIGEGTYPMIKDNVTIFANATIVGNIEVSNNITIGANSLVIHSCTDESSVYAGVPARKI